MERDLTAILEGMSLEEKASLCSGLDFWHTKGLEPWGVPSLMVTDGPHGLRKQGTSSDHLGLYQSVPATCFPSAAGLASTWNRDLLQRVGAALGAECQAENVAVLLGPGANMKRSPLCGRNFEYFSEDPYLSSELATSHINGVQSQGVGASLKHFAVNNQEHRRMSVDAVVDERTLREIYLASFEGAVKGAQPWSVMSSYNKVNGEFASESGYLLTDILRNEWGFEGFVVSDWGAVNDRVESLKAGLELEMPSTGGLGDRRIVEAVRSGELSIEVLDKAVSRMLQFAFRAEALRKPDAAVDMAEHHGLARRAAGESMVLLKNEGALLPLSKSGSIAVIGEFARKPRYQGGGSSHVNPTRLDDTVEEMQKLAGEATIAYAQGYRLEDDHLDESLLREAVAAAASADTAVLFVGLPDKYESEGYDRTHLSLPEHHIALIDAVSKVQQRLVVVLSNGAPLEMPWLDSVTSLLEAYLAGQAFGGAVADLLFGEVSPSGKLAETFPAKLSDNPSYLFFPGEEDTVEYREGIFIGYRYYDTKEIEPLFPFGYGLSYTEFQYSNIKVDKDRLKDTDSVTVSFDIKNVGKVAGQEVAQLYVRDVASGVRRPDKELRAFAKVELQPGESQTVSFTLEKRAFAYYNVSIKDWHVESGEFALLAGASSRHIHLEAVVFVESTVKIEPVYHRNTLLGDLMKNPEHAPLAKKLIVDTGLPEPSDDEEGSLMEAIYKYLPLRGAVAFSQGKVSEDNLNEVLEQLNKK